MLAFFKPFNNYVDDIDHYADALDHHIDDLFRNMSIPWQNNMGANWYELEKEYVFSMNVPGFSNEDINVEVVGRLIKINGKISEKTLIKRKATTIHRQELLPPNININEIKAYVKNGILEIVCQKRIHNAGQEKPKKIEVK